MKVYTVHLPPPFTGRDRDAVLVREGFNWAAFLFTGLWALVNRMWLVGALLIAGMTALGLAFGLLALSETAQWVVTLAVGAWIGASANDWRRAHLAAKGWKEVAVIAAPDRDAAFRRYADLAALEARAAPRGLSAGLLSGAPARS